MRRKPLLKDILPKVSLELKRLLKKDGHGALSATVDLLKVFGRCGCDEKGCASFYTSPILAKDRPLKAETLILKPRNGMLVLDMFDGEISFVEILDRPSIRKDVLSLKPL